MTYHPSRDARIQKFMTDHLKLMHIIDAHVSRPETEVVSMIVYQPVNYIILLDSWVRFNLLGRELYRTSKEKVAHTAPKARIGHG